MNDDTIIVCATILAATAVIIKEKKKKKIWVREWLARRQTFGAYHSLMAELKLQDAATYKNFVRMDIPTFNFLLEKVSPKLTRQNTVMREAIPVSERLAVTLRYLASGGSYTDLQNLFRVEKSTISKFIPETCDAIYSALKSYIQVPTTKEDWLSIAKGFEEKWNFPNCIGALDGKHVLLRHKRKYGSQCFNYKLINSVLLFAMVDADCNFIYIDVGTNGQVNDSTVFSKSSLYGSLENNTLNIPAPSPLPQGGPVVPYAFVSNEAFPLKHYLMKAFPIYGCTRPKKGFNYRLNRARRTVENAFGIMAARFRVLQNVNPLDIEKVERIILACCALHNFLQKSSPKNNYSPPNFFIQEDAEKGEVVSAEWSEHTYAGIRDIPQQESSYFSLDALEVRDELCFYFNSVGKVPWQDKFIH